MLPLSPSPESHCAPGTDIGPEPHPRSTKEPGLKKHLAAALVVATLPAFWVSPAGAAEAKQELHCQGGRIATVTSTSFTNRCRHQWLVLRFWKGESEGYIVNVPPTKRGTVDFGSSVVATLSPGPVCSDRDTVETTQWLHQTWVHGAPGCTDG